MVSDVEEEGTRRGTTMCDAIERHCSGVEEAADPEDSVSGVEEPAGEGFSLFPFSPCLLKLSAACEICSGDHAEFCIGF
jgi:hypothetical protein